MFLDWLVIFCILIAVEDQSPSVQLLCRECDQGAGVDREDPGVPAVMIIYLIRGRGWMDLS